jgi:predicted CopG family antitoxin
MYFISGKVYEDLVKKRLDKDSASAILISLIENSKRELYRVECIRILSQIGLKTLEIFKFLENLLVSDECEYIRMAAFDALKHNFKVKAITPVKYAIYKERDRFFLIKLIDFLAQIDPFSCREVLINKIDEIDESTRNNMFQGYKISNLSLKKLKEKYFDYLFLQSLENLYFHRHTIPFAVDLFYID